VRGRGTGGRADLAALEVAQAVEEVGDNAVACGAHPRTERCAAEPPSAQSVLREGRARCRATVPMRRHGSERVGIAVGGVGGMRACDHSVGEDGVVEVLHLRRAREPGRLK
jgi:hypothetical protein